MKKILISLIIFITSVSLVKANTISNIDMDIYVDIEGTATVTETWNAKVNEGTEGWHPYFNIGSSEIELLEVSMDGKPFEIMSSWNESASLSGKAYKAGLYYPENKEVDICFGITKYGTHTYKIKYKITNFVSQVSDADIIYWTLFPYDFSANPDNVSIKIYSDFTYSDTLDVWGYGKYGAPCYVYNGKIEMTSDGPLYSDEYLTILVKFEKGTFNTNSILDYDFNHYHEMAEEGATTYTESDNKPRSILSIIGGIITTIFNIAIWGAIFYFIAKSASASKKYDFGPTGNKISKDVPMFRDIPCNKDIFRAYWVATNYNLTKKKEDFLGAVILKWVLNNNVRVEKVTKDGIFKDKEEDNIIFLEKPENCPEVEKTIYDYMYESSKDGRLESKEFKKWCSNNYSKILKWFDSVLDYEVSMLVSEGKAVPEVQGKVFKHTVYKIDSSMMEEARQLLGLKNFLKEFSVINEREPIEVNLWKEYLMFAQIFGIADEVAKQFKKLYPEVITEMNNNGYDYTNIYFIHTISSTGIQSASAARQRAQSYSSGGGGFSSGGGGGGSFGGGGGGGGFR